MSTKELKIEKIKRLQTEQKIFWTKKRSDEIAQLWREIEAIPSENTREIYFCGL